MAETTQRTEVYNEPERVRQIVDQMQHDGYEPTLLAFVGADGTTKLRHREVIDLNGFIALLLVHRDSSGSVSMLSWRSTGTRASSWERVDAAESVI